MGPRSRRAISAPLGGTCLLPAANPRGWSEITWTNAGSGCSTEPKPSWQPDTGCPGHSVADVSAVANPYTGVKVYDSDPGATNGWGQVGGTSASTPIIAATYALAGTPGSAGAASSLYVHSDQLNDVVAGVNSPSGCSPTYLCKAGIGYDGPTGLGTPAGIGAFRPGSDAVTDYAIMGDSYSSGEGLGSYDNGSDTTSDQCHRSSLAFGRLYAASKGNVAVHTACSGATIDNITTTGQNGESPQIARVSSNANLVTVTIGGNDAGFASVLTRCLNPLSGSCEDYYTQGDANDEDNLIDSLEPKLAAAYTAIKNKAPYARVVALTYPSIFKPGTTCSGIANVPVSDVQWLNHETFHLDNAIVRAAQDAGIKVVDERYEFVKDGKLQPVATAPAPPPWTGLCPVTAGTWELPYGNGTTQQTATYGSTADIAAGIAIDHVVPKADAWNAGFWSYASDPAGQKEIKDFANDMESPELWAVSSSTNSSKQDSRPDQWMPRNTGVECTYAKAWIIVKYEWYLAVLTTPVDANTLREGHSSKHSQQLPFGRTWISRRG